MRISDWSSDVCSSEAGDDPKATRVRNGGRHLGVTDIVHSALNDRMFDPEEFRDAGFDGHVRFLMDRWTRCTAAHRRRLRLRSEEHTSELQSLMRLSYAVFCLKKKNSESCKH